MKDFNEIDTGKIKTVSEFITRPDGSGTAYVTFQGTRFKKSMGAHVSLTKDEHTSVKFNG
ncbi:MAG: hypothetical protein DRJ01_05865 [Bacteroidetes bacterium]|nr:MAG: hypothetical protein DRJ01_05865 [Bacteroidota bacterium]